MKGIVVIAALVAVVAGAQPRGCPKELSTTLLPDLKDCASFWRCADGLPLRLTCPDGQHFSSRLRRCTLPVFARCQEIAGDKPTHTGLTSGFLDTLRNILSRKGEPVPLAKDELTAAPEVPIGVLPEEVETFQRFPDTEAETPELPDETDEEGSDMKVAEKSEEANSENEEQQSEEVEAKGELDAEKEMEKKKQVEDGKREEQVKSERSEGKIEEEEDEVASDKEKSETSDVGDVVAENDGENVQNSKEATAVLKKKEEEEEEEKEKSKDVKSIKKENKKYKSEDKEKDSGSDDESDDEE